MDGISFRFLNGTFFEMPTLVLNRLSGRLQAKAEIVLEGEL